ncbi:alginate lyase family protein [Pseudodesulfovibrio karagichevae]|uniref:Alginate lyase family protein n=1 Tax=Pseudodesulfovibrio karagichevae TaxID=3239305 RepID=A0ABV4K1F7_9BACT
MIRRPFPFRTVMQAVLSAVCLAAGLVVCLAAPAPAGVNLPQTIVLSPEVLYQSRQRILAREGAVRTAMAALKASADAAMLVPVEPVTAKGRSGSGLPVREYRSLAPYWWPDPKSRTGLPYVRRDGERNPEADSDRYDRKRLTRMAMTVRTLALAWYFTGNQLYAARASAHVRAWLCAPATRMVPNLEHAQMRPGLDQGNRTGIIETAALIPVCDAIRLLEPSKAWTGEDSRRAREWFGKYLFWLLRSEQGRAEAAALNNHGTWFDAQVAAFALFRGDRELAREVAGMAGNRRIATQILPDGSMPRELARTRPRHYTFFNLEALMVLASVGERCGLDLWHWATPTGQSIRRALDRNGPHLDPADPLSGTGADDFDPYPYVPLFRRAALVYNDTRYLDYLVPLDEQTLARETSFIAY